MMRRLGVLAVLLAGAAPGAAAAQDWMPLDVVRPVIACEQLEQTFSGQGELAGVKIGSAAIVPTERGPYCKVSGIIGPGSIKFDVYLPAERWTQRYVQGAQNVLPIPRAGKNEPALRGELAVAITDKGGPGISRETLWSHDNPQKRIDWAYRANHLTAVAAKALIRAYYARPQRFAYFIGCSMGGREVLSNVQRFPADFDGAVAGAPVVVDSLHNAFFPGWEWHANRRADGSIILRSDRLPILHKAAIRQCAAKSGLIDGMLQHPGACSFDPASAVCKAGTTDRATCLTAEEAGVARKLYTGPTDPEGRLLDAGGFPFGSELGWRLSTAAGPANPATDPGNALVRLLAPSDPAENAAAMRKAFGFTQPWYIRAAAMGPLWNTANTNLRSFGRQGGKLILWTGAADTVVQPASTIAYYQGVQSTVGARAADSFARFFMLPGVKHCGGGEGPDQIDVLSAIMAWTERGRAPDTLIAGKRAQPAPEEDSPPLPYSEPAVATNYTRPVFPYPLVARYSGKGDPVHAASYRAVRLPDTSRQAFPPEIARFFGPDNQLFYEVRDGRLVQVRKEAP